MFKPKRFPIVEHWTRNGDHPRDYDKVICLENPERGDFAPLTVVTSEYQKEHDWEGQVVRRFRNPDIRGSEMCQECTYDYDEHGWLDIRPVEDFDLSTMICPGTTIRFIDEYIESAEVYRKSRPSNEL